MVFVALDFSFMLKPVQDVELLFPHWNPLNSKETSTEVGFL